MAVGTGSLKGLRRARRRRNAAALHRTYGGDPSNPHSYGAQHKPLSKSLGGGTLRSADFQVGHDTTQTLHALRAAEDAETTSVSSSVYRRESGRQETGSMTRSQLLRVRRRHRHGLPPAGQAGTMTATLASVTCDLHASPREDDNITPRTCQGLRSQSLSQLRARRRKEAREHITAFAPAPGVGVHKGGIVALQHLADPGQPWFKRGHADTAVGRRLDEAGRGLTRSGLPSLHDVVREEDPLKVRSTSLVQIRQRHKSDHFLPVNPAKVDHFNMGESAGRATKPAHTTRKRWTSAVIDHNILTETSRGSLFPDDSLRPVDASEFAPLYSSFSRDGIFRDPNLRGSTLRAASHLEETPVAQRDRLERKAGHVYGEFVPLARDEPARTKPRTGGSSGQMPPSPLTSAPLTPANLRMAGTQYAGEGFVHELAAVPVIQVNQGHARSGATPARRATPLAGGGSLRATPTQLRKVRTRAFQE